METILGAAVIVILCSAISIGIMVIGIILNDFYSWQEHKNYDSRSYYHQRFWTLGII